MLEWLNTSPPKKHTCDLRALLRESQHTPPTHPYYMPHQQYDSFIFKDGFTQSSYTFNKLTGSKCKGFSKTKSNKQRQQDHIMRILTNIRKYRNREILSKASKNKQRDQSMTFKREVKTVHGSRRCATPSATGWRRREIDEASKTFFRQYLYEGESFKQKQKIEQKLRRSRNQGFEVDDDDGSMEDPLAHQLAQKQKRIMLEDLNKNLDKEFMEKYADECKQIESDLKVKLGQIPRHLIQPDKQSPTQSSVKTSIRRHQKKYPSQPNILNGICASIHRRSLVGSDITHNTFSPATFKLKNSWFIDNKVCKSNKQAINFLTSISKHKLSELQFQLKAKPKLVASVDQKNNNALHYAAKSCDVDIVDMLVKNGCDPFATNTFDKRPMDIARHFDNDLVVGYFTKLMLSR